jgi:uncharacterized radical SAM protein YgiQ
MWGVTAGNMDSMVNRYTSDRRLRHDDAYSPGGAGGRRPDRALIAYAQRCREAFADVPVIAGGIEASLRRIAHYDYWSNKVRRSALIDSRADLLVYGNGERAVVEIAHRLAAGEAPASITDVRGTAFARPTGVRDGWTEVDSTTIDTPGPPAAPVDPYAAGEGTASDAACAPDSPGAPPAFVPRASLRPRGDRARTVVRMPDFDAVSADPILYAHASRILHVEANPGNARALVQRHGDRDVWLNPPPMPLSTPEMDRIYELPYTRKPHPVYGDAKIPAYEMIRFSVTIMRGCFGGCTFCSITEHEGRVIQNRSEGSILREIETVRDTVPGFTGVISDVGGPTANMYRLACRDPKIEAACRLPSCVYPGICPNLRTDHSSLIQLYRKARALPGIKKVLVASGVRYDLAATSKEYVRELATHHVGGYLKIAPEHTEEGPLSMMLKPGIGSYESSSSCSTKRPRRREEAVSHPVLHRGPSGDHGPGHAGAGVMAQAQRLPRRPGAELLAVADGDRDGDVPHRPQPAEKLRRDGGGCLRSEGAGHAPPPQGVPALPRPGELAAAARGAAADGAWRPDRQRAGEADPAA